MLSGVRGIKKMKRQHCLKKALFLAGLIVVMGTLLPGCGIKGPPLPPLSTLPPAPDQVTGGVAGNHVTLEWRLELAPGKEKPSHDMTVEVFRADRSIGEDACTTCPLSFEKRASLPVSTRRFKEIIEKGFQYFYRVRIRQGKQIAGEFSETVEIIHE